MKLSELVTHYRSKKCRVRADPKDIYGPVVNYLERALALWRPNANQEPRIEYRLRWDSTESPRMMVEVIELPPTGAASKRNTNGKSLDNASPSKDIAMLEYNVEASSFTNEVTGPTDSNGTNHAPSTHTSSSQLYDNHHYEITPRLMISAGSPEDSSQPADLPIVTQPMGSCEISEGKTTNSFFPSTSSDTSFLTNPTDALEWSQQMGEPLSVPMKINQRLEAVLSGTETESPYSGNASAWDTVSRLSKISDLTASSESRENRFHRKYHPRNDGGSTHRDRRQHESQMAVALTSQEQELSQDQSSNENELDEDSTDDDESGGVPL